MNRAQLAIASAFEATGLSRTLLALQRVALRPYARALNYHDVPYALAPAFESQLQFYARHFVSMNYQDLLSLHAGEWPYEKPGLLLSFDDGLRSHAEVVAPHVRQSQRRQDVRGDVALRGDSQAVFGEL